jgi:cell division septal protein FtsQ
MRDYRYVRVPKQERTPRKGGILRRAQWGGGGRKRGMSPRAPLAGLFAVVVAAGLCYGAWAGYRWMTTAPLFRIAGVDVRGVQRVSEDELRELAGLFTGRNIFQVDLAGAARRAAAHPWVQDVRVERKLPNRISIMIRERLPRAVLLAANGRFLIDRAGTVITPARDGDESGLPRIAVSAWSAAVRATVEAPGMLPALALLDELLARGGWEPGEVTLRADAPETVSVLYAGREFRIGAGNYPEKLQRIGEIVSDMNRRGAVYTYIDVRPDRQAAVMVKPEGPGAGGKGQGRKKRA